jgi:hypothetical protein
VAAQRIANQAEERKLSPQTKTKTKKERKRGKKKKKKVKPFVVTQYLVNP